MPCDDANACTSGDTCSGGRCVGGLLRCDDGNPCTDDVCSGNVCVRSNNNAPCNDGNACTLNDTCSGGSCAQGIYKSCEPIYDYCYFPDGICNPASGNCEYSLRPDGTYCDDGIYCTYGDSCYSGFCQGIQDWSCIEP